MGLGEMWNPSGIVFPVRPPGGDGVGLMYDMDTFWRSEMRESDIQIEVCFYLLIYYY
jgi:hypothetical protein